MIRCVSRHKPGRAPSRKPWSARSRYVVTAFIDACEHEDPDALGRVLRRDAALTVDSGGTLPIRPHAHGRADVAQLILELIAHFPGVRLEPGHINGGPGIVLRASGQIVGVLNAVRRGRAAQELWIVVNPEKLRHWNAI